MIIKNIAVSCCLVVICFPIYSQKIDSLKALLETNTHLDRADVLYELSYNYIEIDNNIALKYGLEGYNIAVKSSDSLRIVRTGLITASALRRLQKIDSAIVIYNSILGIAERNNFTEELAVGSNSMGIACTFKAQYDKALHYYFQSLALRELSRDTASQARVLLNIGTVYYKLKNYQKALDIFLDCRELKIKCRNHEDDDLLFMNIAHCHAYLGNYQDAKLYIERALMFCGKECSGNTILSADFATGLIHFGLKEYDIAENYFLKSFLLAKTLNDIRFQLDNIEYLSQIFLQQGRITPAIYYLNQAESLINQNDSFNLEMIKIYARFTQLYLQLKNFHKASDYMVKYIELKDRVYNEELTINLMKTEAEFMERENRAKIKAQNETLLLKEEVINHQSIQNIVTGLLGLITLAFLIFLYRDYRRKRDLNLMLDQKINERTRELESSRDELLTALKEQDLRIQRASKDVSETINTIKGLCFTGKIEVTDPIACSYIKMIDKTFVELANSLDGFSGIRHQHALH